MAGSGNEVQKIDSNITGLRAAEEASLCTLPAVPVWRETEPNGYQDFGGEITTVARTPINPSRQRKKGSVTDKDASAGFGTDVTQTNLQRFLRSFCFADFREQPNTDSFNKEPVYNPDGTVATASTKITFTGVTGASGTFTASGGGLVTEGFITNHIVLFEGFTNAANNGIKVLTATTATTLVAAGQGVVDETPPATAKATVVGYQFVANDAGSSANGSSFPTLTRAGAFDLTTLGLIPGQSVFVGGDTAATRFTNAANNGVKRVRSVAAGAITLDKSTEAIVDETLSGGETLQLFFPSRVLKNESNPDLIKRFSWQFERTLGANDLSAPTNQQAEYVVGSVANELSLNFATADKLTADLSFVAADTETLDENNLPAFFNRTTTAADAIKSDSSNLGSVKVPVVEADAFNTSSDLSRVALTRVVDGDEDPTPLFAIAQEATITINNNAEGNKGLGVLGSFEISAGTFEVGGDQTAYFTDVAAQTAVQNAEDVSLDFLLVKQNAGVSIDLPLLTIGDGRANIELNQPITVPISNEAATGAKIDTTLDHTIMFGFYDYLPTAADL